MSDDLVNRLQELADCDARAGEPLGNCMREAADHIEKLEAKLAQVTQERNHANDCADAAIEAPNDKEQADE